MSRNKNRSIRAVIRNARAQGRAEAATIISRLCPETGLDKCFGCSPNGDAGDYSTYWNVQELRKLLHADIDRCEEIDRLHGVDWMLHYREHDLAKFKAQSEALLDGMMRIMHATRLGDAAFAIATEVVGELNADAAPGETPEELYLVRENAKRYKFLRSRLLGVVTDFDDRGRGVLGLSFKIAGDHWVGCDENIDTARGMGR